MKGVRCQRFEECIVGGGVALFPSDTVYGLACDPSCADAVDRLYALKDRPPAKAAAVMFFDVEAAFATLPELGERTRGALRRLLPGGVTVLLRNPEGRFPLACAGDPGTLGLRVVAVPALLGAEVAVLQSSANLAGGHDARRLDDVPPVIRAGVDMEIDGGELPGTPSTVVDLREYEDVLSGGWRVVRSGAVADEVLAEALDGRYHFNPETYPSLIREEIPGYDELHAELVAASGGGGEVRRILELGTGTGETARRLLARFPQATLVGIDESPAMLEVAAASLDADRATLHVGRLQDPLPEGPFDLVASALCVHHLDGDEKPDLIERVRAALGPGGRFVLADVIVPDDPADARIPLTPGYDRPSSVFALRSWLEAVGFEAGVTWQQADLVVIAAEAPR